MVIKVFKNQGSLEGRPEGRGQDACRQLNVRGGHSQMPTGNAQRAAESQEHANSSPESCGELCFRAAEHTRDRNFSSQLVETHAGWQLLCTEAQTDPGKWERAPWIYSTADRYCNSRLVQWGFQMSIKKDLQTVFSVPRLQTSLSSHRLLAAPYLCPFSV